MGKSQTKKEKTSGGSIWRFIGKRLLTLIPVLLGITIMTYGLMYLSPSDPIEMLLRESGTAATPEVVAAMKHNAGLDRPFLVQYFSWLFKILRGDMGVSLVDGKSIAEQMSLGIPKTMLLSFSSILVTIFFSVPIGIFTAVHHGRASDTIIRFCCFVANAMPSFLVSLLMLYVIAYRLHLLPVLANSTFQGLLMPTLALAVPMIGRYIRQVRAAVLEQLAMPYVEGGVARGLRQRVILFKNVLRCSMSTIITLMALSVGSLMGGTVAIERIFNYRGMGFFLMDAITSRDYPVVQAFVVWMAFIYVIVNLISDVIYYFLDPRVRYETED